MALTWGELKAMVDCALKEAGQDDSIEIEYFDFSWPEKEGPKKPDVYIDEKLVVHS